MDLSFVFPCLNEEETLAHCIGELKHSLDASGIDYEIIVVDNGSRDRSAEIARECGALVVNESRKGYGAALSSGIRHASGTYVAFADADGSYPLEKIGEMYRLAEKSDADMVIASRFRGTIEPGAMPASHRYLGTPVLTALINLIYRGRLSDCNSGFRLLRKSACESWGVHSDGMEFASELLIKALKNRAEIAELPGGLRKDLRSRPPHLKTWRDGMRHLLYILSEAPGLFEKSGLFLVLLGTLIQIACFFTGMVTVGGMSIGGIHTKLFALIFGTLGVQIYLLACFLVVVSPEERCMRFTRMLINMPADLLFFLLCGLGVVLLGGLGFIALAWGMNHFSNLNMSALLLLLTHFVFLIGFSAFGLLGIHIVQKKIPSL